MVQDIERLIEWMLSNEKNGDVKLLKSGRYAGGGVTLGKAY